MSSDVTPQTVSWGNVLKGEHEAINQRRKIQKRQFVAAANTVAGQPYGESGQFDTAGLALSGGGIRSAAFCLGTMQALAEHKVIDRIDYLSTVSGGGYTGTATTSAMSVNGGVFPFAGAANDMRDPRELGHIRDYSNYLIPRGKFSLLSDIAIVVRGLVTNALLVFPVILFAAAVTICLNPTREALSQPYFTNAYLRGQFAITIGIALFCLVMFSVWAIYRSVFKIGESEFGGLSIKAGVALLVLLSASAFCELQPVIINWMYDTAHANGGIENCGTPSPQVPSCLGGGPNNFRAWVTAIITYVTPLVAVVSLYAKRIGEILKTEANSDSYVAITKRIVGKVAIWGVALAMPIILWMVYLLFAYWGIPGGPKDDAPEWLWWFWRKSDLSSNAAFPAFARIYGLIAGAMILAIWPFLDPNSNSLHRLYRDRLSDAFLFGTSPDGKLTAKNMKLSDLNTACAPYHLINAALNIQGSPEANRRGRNADFFFFSKRYSGSLSSLFEETETFEKDDPALSLGTAMAISGAAVSSNMGSASIGPMAPTLALLNLRLGYWLKNPGGEGLGGNLLYLLREMFSLLKPRGKWLYLTDGGHIDNTGLYELLRRRCSHIIVVDAEADPNMTFASFVKVQRHARIDLGVRINLRWDKIAATSLRARTPDVKPLPGPHCAIGEINYSDGGKGTLIYVKSSLSGDENVYVRDYARRHPDYPHETTADQFFNEEQFEVYRALGFHCVHGLYKSKERDEAEISVSGVEVHGTVKRVVENAVLAGRNYSSARPSSKQRTKAKARRR